MNGSLMNATSVRFSINLPGDTPVTEVLDIWQPQLPDTAVFAFGPAAAVIQDVTWRADFPAEPALAYTALAAPYDEIAAVESALEQVDRRLEAFIAMQSVGAPGQFDAALPLVPEQTLAGLLAVSTQPASFALGDPWRTQWTSAAESVRTFLNQVRQMLDAYAWIETAVDGQLIARTRVSWTGDFDTASLLPVSMLSGQRHAETVALALASRAVWVRFAGHMLTRALDLGKWLAVPGGAAAALPGLWRFINDMIDEYRRIKRAAHP